MAEVASSWRRTKGAIAEGVLLLRVSPGPGLFKPQDTLK